MACYVGKINFGPIAGVVGGLCLGAAIGLWAAHVIQGWVYGDPLLANLPPGLAGLFGGLFASGGFKLGRWLSSIRHLQLSMRTVSLEFLLATVRVATAAMGLFIGAYAGLWTAGLALYLYEPYAKGLDDKDWFAGNAIIGSGFLWGGLLAVLGYGLGRSLPAAASWTGLLLGLLAGIYAAPLSSRPLPRTHSERRCPGGD